MNIEITNHIKQDCGMVFADPTQVHQIFMNLVTNAYHAVEKTGGTIDLELKESVFEKDDLHVRDLGAKGFLKKPVATGDLAEMIKKVLEQAKVSTHALLI